MKKVKFITLLTAILLLTLVCVSGADEYMYAMNDTKGGLDSLNMKSVGWALYGDARNVYSNDSITYLSAGSAFLIFDTSVEDSINLISAYNMGGWIYNFEVRDNYVFIAADSTGAVILDISDLASPVEISRFETGGSVHDIVIERNTMFIADEGAGFVIVDISDIQNPVEIKRTYAGSAYSLFIDGYIAYVIYNLHYVRIFNISKLAYPKYLGYASLDYLALDMEKRLGCLLIANGNGGVGIVDVNIPNYPIVFGYFDTPGWTTSLHLDSNYLYTANNAGGLSVIDASNPLSMSIVGSISETTTSDVFFKEGKIYSADIGLNIYEAPDSGDTQLLCNFETSGSCMDIEIKGEYAYLASDGLRILNISDISNMYTCSCLPIPNTVREVQVQGNYAYLAADRAGLRIIDVSDPYAPLEIGFVEAESSANGLFVVDTIVYVSDREKGLYVFNVSDPTNPIEVGYYMAYSFAEGVYVKDNYAYVPGNHGLNVYEVSNPARPDPVTFYGSTLHYSNDVFVQGKYAYVADDVFGFEILDVSTPDNIIRAGHFDNPDEAIRVFVENGFAYLSDGDSGLRIIDIRKPSCPVEIAYYDTPSHTMAAVIIDSLIFIADHGSGLLVLRQCDTSSGIDLEKRDIDIKVNNYYIQYSSSSVEMYLGMKNAGTVELDIFDKIGRKLGNLINKETGSGYTKVTINKSDYPAGEYFIKGRMGETEISTKIIIMK